MFKLFRLQTLILIFALSVLGAKSLIAASMEADEAAAYANLIHNLVSNPASAEKERSVFLAMIP